MNYCFTSIDQNYLANARVLAHSFKSHHPQCKFVLLFCDYPSNSINWELEPFDEIYYITDVIKTDAAYYTNTYNVIELCTALKGKMIEELLSKEDTENVIYLDPDIVVFNALTHIFEILKTHNLVLTPHLTHIEETIEGIENHEIATLKHGTYNLGFIAVNNNAVSQKAMEWYANRTLNFSQIDFERGLFTDQKWANLLPIFFEKVYILKDEAYNVATWNIHKRKIKFEEDKWYVNEKLLRFYHFSGFKDNCKYPLEEIKRFDPENKYLISLWDWYNSELKANY